MRRHGSQGQVRVGSPAVIVTALNKWTLNMARDRVEVTAFGDANKEYVQGLMEIKGTIAGAYDVEEGSPAGGNAIIWDIADGEVPVELQLVPTMLDPGKYWTGLAYLDASVDVDAKGAVTIAGTFAAAGPWSRVGF